MPLVYEYLEDIAAVHIKGKAPEALLLAGACSSGSQDRIRSVADLDGRLTVAAIVVNDLAVSCKPDDVLVEAPVWHVTSTPKNVVWVCG